MCERFVAIGTGNIKMGCALLARDGCAGCACCADLRGSRGRWGVAPDEALEAQATGGEDDGESDRLKLRGRVGGSRGQLQGGRDSE